MTRSASPNGAVEFSYDFPVASTSKLPYPPRTRTPTRPRWEQSSYKDDDEDFEDAEIDYDAFGYPTSARQRQHRAHTHPVPTPTRNQWRAPSPPLYPYAPYPYSAPLLLAPPAPQLSSSYESNCSILSSCSKDNHKHAKIRKPRRSVDSDRDAAPISSSFLSASSPTSSPSNSPYFSSCGDDFDNDDEEEHEAHSYDDHIDREEQDEQQQQDEEKHGHAPSSFRKQWAALSLRVQFGVFRAKRKMRNRVMSL